MTQNGQWFFTCPHCNKEITKNDFKEHNVEAINSFIKKELKTKEEKIRTEIKEEFAIKQNFEIEKQKLIFEKELSTIKMKLDSKENELEEIQSKIKTQFESDKKDLELKYINEINELNSRISDIKKDRSSIIEKIELEKKSETEKLQMEFKLDLINKETEIRQRYENQIRDLEIANAKSKILQNKTKGENFEIEVESELRKCFGTQDKIEKATISIENTKPDFIQEVNLVTNNKSSFGKIIYEVKNAAWSNGWESKLSGDVAKNKGRFGILITANFEERFKGVPFIRSNEFDNIWITNAESFVFVAQMLRNIIIIESQCKNEINNLKNKMLDSASEEERESISKLIKSYEEKIDSIQEFMTSEVPKALNICRKELKNLGDVSKSMISSIKKLDKARERIEKQLETKIIDGLYKAMSMSKPIERLENE